MSFWAPALPKNLWICHFSYHFNEVNPNKKDKIKIENFWENHGFQSWFSVMFFESRFSNPIQWQQGHHSSCIANFGSNSLFNEYPLIVHLLFKVPTFWLWTERTKQQKKIEVVVKSMLLLLQISMHICLVLFSQKGLIILVSVFCIGFCILDGTKKLMLGFGWLQLLLLVEDDLGCFEVVEILHFLLKQLLTWLDSSLFYWYVMNLIKMHSWSQQISLGINHCSFIF